MLYIEVDTKKAKAHVRQTLVNQEKLHVRLACDAVTTVWHAAQHGDPTMLNNFYTGLSKTMQAAFKRWVSAEIASRYPEGTKSSAFWMGFKQEAFHVRKGTMEERAKFRVHVEESVVKANEEGSSATEKSYGRFFEKDPTKEPNLFDDTALMKRFWALINSASKDDSEVSAVVIDGLKRARDAFEGVVGVNIAEVAALPKGEHASIGGTVH